MKAIAHACPCLVYFAGLVLAPLSKPQYEHLVRLADAGCLAIPSPTLGALQRLFLDAPDPTDQQWQMIQPLIPPANARCRARTPRAWRCGS
jgi:hypothetical protein